jgi:hypothetical protein
VALSVFVDMVTPVDASSVVDRGKWNVSRGGFNQAIDKVIEAAPNKANEQSPDT